MTEVRFLPAAAKFNSFDSGGIALITRAVPFF